MSGGTLIIVTTARPDPIDEERQAEAIRDHLRSIGITPTDVLVLTQHLSLDNALTRLRRWLLKSIEAGRWALVAMRDASCLGQDPVAFREVMMVADMVECQIIVTGATAPPETTPEKRAAPSSLLS